MAQVFVEKVRLLEWMETDAAGHQHYTSAFRWVEECESALYRKLNLPASLFGLIPRVKVQMEYKRRIYFGEEIITRLEVLRVGNSSLEFGFTAHVGGELAAVGNYVIVHAPEIDEGSKPWPDAWRTAFLGE
ncbi:MAG: hotdog domain-containing protein [Actinomycetes bacterium]